MGPTQHPIQWIPGALFLEIKRPGREADHSPPYSVELYLHSHNTPSWNGAQLKHRDNFTFYPIANNTFGVQIPTAQLSNLCASESKFTVPIAEPD